MPSDFNRRIRWLSVKLGFERDWYLVFIAAIIGVLMGAVATAFILPLRWLEHLGQLSGARGGWLHVLILALVPVGGALLAGLVMHLLGKGGGEGPGVTTIMYAIHRTKSRLPLRTAITKWLASTLTIGSGGSAGAEGPIVTIGGVFGSWVGRLLNANPQNTATLLGCGAAAGIASVFNAPIAGIFFVLEVLLRDFSLRTFTPIVIASVISTTWTRMMLGKEPLFGLDPDFFRSAPSFELPEVPNVLLLGLVCGVAAPLFIKALYWTEGVFGRAPLHRILKPAAGAAVLGLLGVGYFGLAPQHHAFHSVPPFYGNGYPVINELISASTYFQDTAHSSLLPVSGLLPLLVAITLLKAVATCLTIGSGGSGGLFAPSLLIGAGMGGAVGVIVNALGWFPAASPAQYALLGMAAMVASLTHAPLTGILLVYEITQRYELVLPLMLVAVISTIVARLILPHSVYTLKLERLGIQIGGMSDLMILRRLSVRDVPLAPVVAVRAGESAQRLLELSELSAASDFVVLDSDNRYAGMVTSADLRAALVYREAIPLLQVSELQRTDLPTVEPDETLDIVLGKFSRHDVQSLPVVEAADGAVLGLITRARLMQRYQGALSKD